MRCLVTGAAGFLGSHLLSHLLQSGNTVTIILRPATDDRRIRYLLPHVNVIAYDLANIGEVGDRILAAQPEIVFHLAWIGGNNSIKKQNDLSQIADNLPGSMLLLQKCIDAGIRRWIGIGSALEYGNRSGLLHETDTPHPRSLYGISKYALCLAAAKLCELSDIECLWIRPFATYGLQDNPSALIPFVIQSLLRGERPPLTAGEQCWDYLYADDAARAMVQLGAAPGARGVFNLASGEAYILRGLIERIRDLINPALPLGFGEIAYPADQIMSLQADVSRLKLASGWSPEVSFEEGARRVIEEYQMRNRDVGL